MATAATIRARIYEQLYSDFPNDRPFETLLTEALDNSETDIDVTDGTDWDEGDILEHASTGERMLVLSVSSNTLTVERSYGTVAATAGVGAADRVRKNPRFTQDQIDSAITDALNAMESWGIHGFATGSLTLAASQYGYDVSETDVDATLGVLSVYYVEDTTKVPVPLPFTQQARVSTADADWSAARQLTLHSKGDRSTTASDVYYTYAQALTFDTDLDTTIAKVLVQQEELLVLASMARLLGYTITPMTQDPGQRTDRTVPPGQTGRDVRHFQGDFFIKARAEAARLAVERQRLPRHRRTARAGRWRW